MHQRHHCHPAGVDPQTPVDSDWLRPDWPAPAHVHALCTTRAGGVSSGAYASMNLGSHVGDADAAVAANRARLQQALSPAGTAVRPVFLNQVHGTAALVLAPGMADGQNADAAATRVPGLACTVMVADCLPVLFTDRAGSAVAAAHAGWRGLVGGVLDSILKVFKGLPLNGIDFIATNNVANDPLVAPDGLLAWLGPCIGPRAFEVGPEVREAFCAVDAACAVHFAPQPGGKYLADLPGLARQRLAGLGVSQVYGNDSSDAWCTVAQGSRFFSHRRDGSRTGGGTGRMAACIWLG